MIPDSHSRCRSSSESCRVAFPQHANSPGPVPESTGQWKAEPGLTARLRHFFDPDRVTNHSLPSVNPGATAATWGIPAASAVPM